MYDITMIPNKEERLRELMQCPPPGLNCIKAESSYYIARVASGLQYEEHFRLIWKCSYTTNEDPRKIILPESRQEMKEAFNNIVKTMTDSKYTDEYIFATFKENRRLIFPSKEKTDLEGLNPKQAGKTLKRKWNSMKTDPSLFLFPENLQNKLRVTELLYTSLIEPDNAGDNGNPGLNQEAMQTEEGSSRTPTLEEPTHPPAQQ
jgi:hypothetical protein